MKVSDMFKNMDEVRAYAKKCQPHLSAEDYDTLLFALGIRDNKAVSEIVEIDGEEIKIDKFLVPMIKDLNERGTKTLACCSGLQEEHYTDTKFPPKDGYLSIEYNDVLFDRLQRHKIDGVRVEDSECYLKHCISIYVGDKDNQIGDDLMKEIWNKVWRFLTN